MKSTLAAIGLAVSFAGTALDARAEPGFYIGAGVVSGSGEFDDSFAVARVDNDTRGASFKLGYALAGGNRIEVSYSSIDLEFPTVERTVSGLDVDFLWVFGSDRLRPYVGVGLGAYVFEDSAQFFANNEDLAGVALNLSAGIVYELADRFEIEAALRLKSIESEEIQAISGVRGSWNQTMTNFYFGANLRF